MLCREAGTRRVTTASSPAVDARALARERFVEELLGSWAASSPAVHEFSPKRMNLRGAVRVPLPPSDSTASAPRCGAAVAATTRLVAGLGALTPFVLVDLLAAMASTVAFPPGHEASVLLAAS